jgi:hypothetical protein
MYPRGWNVTEKYWNKYHYKDPKTNSTTDINKFVKQVIFSSPTSGVNFTITIWEIEANSWRVTTKDDRIYSSLQDDYPGQDPRSIANIDRRCSVAGINSCAKVNVHTINETSTSYISFTLHYEYEFKLLTPNTSVFNHYKNLMDYMMGTVKIKDIRTT